jgi:hypothetical protein
MAVKLGGLRRALSLCLPCKKAFTYGEANRQMRTSQGAKGGLGTPTSNSGKIHVAFKQEYYAHGVL